MNPFIGAISLTPFTDGITEVVTAVNAALGTTITAGLGIAGAILGGLILYRLFRKVVKA